MSETTPRYVVDRDFGDEQPERRYRGNRPVDVAAICDLLNYITTEPFIYGGTTPEGIVRVLPTDGPVISNDRWMRWQQRLYDANVWGLAEYIERLQGIEAAVREFVAVRDVNAEIEQRGAANVDVREWADGQLRQIEAWAALRAALGEVAAGE